MAINYEAFNFVRAICLYLGADVKEHQIDWVNDVVVDLQTETILEWNITTKPKPTIEQLDEAWESGKLPYYKTKQKERIKAQFEYALSHEGSKGCLTTILDTEGNRIRMDARRDSKYNDVQNYQIGLEFMTRNNLTEFQYRDFYDVYHNFSLSQAQTIYNEVVDYGFSLLQHKWIKDSAIDACTAIADIIVIGWEL